MSLVLNSILFVFITLLLSQFGGKLNAKSSLSWWLLFAFLLICSIYPEGLHPIAQWLGVQVVSNLVLATLILCLMVLNIQENATSTSLNRRLRDSVTTVAAKEFAAKNPLTLGKGKKNVLVVFPTYNEETSLPSMFGQISRFVPGEHFQFSFCFVNDGSGDHTEKLLQEFAPNAYTSHSTNVGVAGAMLTGFKILKNQGYDYVVQCDADGQHPIEDILRMLSYSDEHQIELLIGSRYLDSKILEKHESSTLSRKFGSWLIAGALRLFSASSPVTDPTSGFRVYSKSAVNYLIQRMPDDYPEPESAALMLLGRKKVRELSVRMQPRQAGVSSLSGWKSAQYMVKVLTALVGLRLRSWG